METLLAVLVTWLSVNFGLPASEDYPRVELASQSELVELRYGELHPDAGAAAQGSVYAGPADDLQAVYEDESRTIYLLEGWTGANPAGSSVLVHELVHHLQNVAGLKYDCAGGREKPAYAAQEKWLALFGTTLQAEFDVDPLSLLVRTNCLG